MRPIFISAAKIPSCLPRRTCASQATQVIEPDLLKEKEMAEQELRHHETFVKVHEKVLKLPNLQVDFGIVTVVYGWN